MKDLNTEDGARGWFYMDGKTPVIAVSRNQSEVHQRFTIAHELGHYFLNHEQQPPDTQEQIQNATPFEVAANRFASELLMPQQKAEVLLKKSHSQTAMARCFNVSDESMGFRLDNLGYEYDRECIF